MVYGVFDKPGHKQPGRFGKNPLLGIYEYHRPYIPKASYNVHLHYQERFPNTERHGTQFFLDAAFTSPACSTNSSLSHSNSTAAPTGPDNSVSSAVLIKSPSPSTRPYTAR